MTFEKDIEVVLGSEDFRCDISTTRHSLVGDETEANGGKYVGPVPKEYLLASLGECTAITLKMYANHKGWTLTDVRVNLNLEQEIISGITHSTIKRDIVLQGDLTEEQRARILQVANSCPVHKLLMGELVINTQYAS